MHVLDLDISYSYVERERVCVCVCVCVYIYIVCACVHACMRALDLEKPLRKVAARIFGAHPFSFAARVPRLPPCVKVLPPFLSYNNAAERETERERERERGREGGMEKGRKGERSKRE